MVRGFESHPWQYILTQQIEIIENPSLIEYLWYFVLNDTPFTNLVYLCLRKKRILMWAVEIVNFQIITIWTLLYK